MTTSTAYEPVFSDGTLPTTRGMFGTDIHACFSPEKQHLEAAKLLKLIKTSPAFELGRLTLMHMPAPLLVQVPGTNKVCTIHGVAPFLGDPFAEKAQLEGKLLGLDGDIDLPTDRPGVLLLPPDFFVTTQVTIPKQKALEDKILTKPRNAGTSWFRAATIPAEDATTAEMAKAIPFPLYMLYNNLFDDAPAHVVWERVRSMEPTDEEPSQLLTAIKNFLAAASTSYANDAPNIKIPASHFASRTSPEMRTLAKECVHLVYTLSATVPPDGQNPQDNQALMQTLLQTLLATQGPNGNATHLNPQSATRGTKPTEIMKAFGMCDSDYNQFLTMCGITVGNEELLP